MKLPKNYFDNLSATKYREYLKLLPQVHADNTKIFITLALTFTALSIFGVFAINPTLTTIVDLKRQLADSTLVQEQLAIKISNLSILQQKYNLINTDLPLIYGAIPQNASATNLTGQIQALAQQQHVNITSFRIFEVELASEKQTSPVGSSYTFFLEANGSYDEMITFASMLAQFNRIVTVESISITKDAQKDGLILSLRGRAYYKK